MWESKDIFVYRTIPTTLSKQRTGACK